jgi:hypothetical protein
VGDGVTRKREEEEIDMGLFKQMKDAKKAIEAAPDIVSQAMQTAGQAQQLAAAQQAAAQQAMAQQAMAQQMATAQPSAAAGPGYEPIAGVSLELFAQICKGLAAYGYDQSKGAAVAATKGVAPDAWQQALDGWNERIRSNPAMAQRFNVLYQGS